jgi:hypothetical protein
MRIEARQKRGHRVYTEYGDLISGSKCDEKYHLVLHTVADAASADEDRHSNSKKLQAQIDRLLLPFVRATWTAAAKTVRP